MRNWLNRDDSYQTKEKLTIIINKKNYTTQDFLLLSGIWFDSSKIQQHPLKAMRAPHIQIFFPPVILL